jgi:hypothetical protein
MFRRDPRKRAFDKSDIRGRGQNNTAAPKQRLPGRRAQPEGNFLGACTASDHFGASGVCGARSGANDLKYNVRFSNSWNEMSPAAELEPASRIVAVE